MLAAWIFLDTEQESSPKDTNPKQITIFANMLKFFIAGIPKLRSRVKFTNFAAAVLFFIGLADAAITVKTADNVEITAFMQSESRKVLQIPDTLSLSLTFQTAKDKHGRAFFLFFMGERSVSLKMDYSANLPTGPFKGTMQADSSWYTGYCGMIECQTKPMPAQQRIDVMRALVTRLLTELNSKFYLIFREPPVAPAAINATDSTTARDSVPAAPAQDSVSQ